MAEETTETKTDIYMQQKKTIDTLIDVLEKQGGGQPQQIVYATPSQSKKTPNYLLYAAAGLAAIILFRKG